MHWLVQLISEVAHQHEGTFVHHRYRTMMRSAPLREIDIRVEGGRKQREKGFLGTWEGRRRRKYLKPHTTMTGTDVDFEALRKPREDIVFGAQEGGKSRRG